MIFYGDEIYSLIILLIISIITAEKHGFNHLRRRRGVEEDSSKSSDELKKLLTGNRTQWQQYPIDYIPIIELKEDVWWQAQLTPKEIWESRNRYPAKYSLNHLVGPMEDIEIYINENDERTSQLWIDGFKEQLQDTVKYDKDRFNKFIDLMGGKSNLTEDDFDTDLIEINGYSPTSYYADPNEGGYSSTGMKGEYFKISHTCTQLKGCNVYPIFRFVHKSKSIKDEQFSCNQIMTELLPQIYDCIDKYGKDDCDLLLDNGYFREVFKVRVPNTDKFVVLKMMRPKRYDDHARDLQRNVRESILLYYLQKEEDEYIDKYGAQFVSQGVQRAFPYVRELGHCMYPTYISVTPYYNMTLEKYIKRGYPAHQTIKSLLKMAVDIARGTEVIHNIRGGPYHHADIAIDQYMMDENGRVLLNDFNRGKFQYYRFPEDFGNGPLSDLYDGIVKCKYCPYESDGRNRAPEEFVVEPLDEGIDVYSTAMVIWSLFSGTRPWTKPYLTSDSSSEEDRIDYDDIEYLLHDTARRPIMPYNMPYALKDVIRWALSHDPRDRPNAREFRRSIEDIYDNIKQYTRNQHKMAAGLARKRKLFKDHRYPEVPHNFPKCCLTASKQMMLDDF